MGLLARILGRKEKRAIAMYPIDMLPPLFGWMAGNPLADSGITVTHLNALTVSAVYCCVSILSSAVAGLPYYVQDADSGRCEKQHRTYRLLNREPNEFMTAVVFREAMQAQALLWGAAYAAIERDAYGDPIALYPMMSQTVTPLRRDNLLWYQVQIGDGAHYLRPDQVLMIPGGFTLNGISPLSAIRQGTNAIGLTMAVEKFAAKFFANGGNIGGILKLPPGMDDNAIKRFVESWKKNYVGSENAFKIAVLENSMELTKTDVSPEQGQMLESRKHQVREVIRYFHVPPHMVADIEKPSYASIEQQAMEFVQYGIQPHVNRWEREIEVKLFREDEKDRIEATLDMDAVTKADKKSRYEAHNVGIQGGWVTVNEVRAEEGLPPVDGGDVLRVPLNMAPAASDTQQKQPAKPVEDDDESQATERAALLMENLHRLAVKESKALTRMAKKCGKDADFMRNSATEWYEKHEALVRRVMSLPLKITKSSESAENFAQKYCARQLLSLTEVLKNGMPVDVIDDFCDEIESIRPAEIAREVVNG